MIPSRKAGRAAGLVFSVGLACLASHDLHGQERPGFCAAAAKDVQADPRLSEAVAAVFGPVRFSSKADECTYPLTALHYADADVLLTQGNVPGEGCHGCGAKLSAFVLRRADGGMKLVKRMSGFTEAGSHGSAGDISAVTLGGDDAVAIEGGGTFQGYSFTNLGLYAFRQGRIVELTADPAITINADNGGAETDDAKAISVDGKWAIDPATKTDVTVTYTIKANGKTRQASVAWSLHGTKFVLTKGAVPQEVATASGQ